MDLLKVFDCIPCNLLVVNLPAYGFDKTALLYIYSYLKKKQCVRINNIHSGFEEIISGVPKGSLLRPKTLFLMIFFMT